MTSAHQVQVETCVTEEWPPNGTSVRLTYGCYAKAPLGHETDGRYDRSDPAAARALQRLLAARLQAGGGL